MSVNHIGLWHILVLWALYIQKWGQSEGVPSLYKCKGEPQSGYMAVCILSMHCLSVLVWVSHLWLCNFECQMTLQSAASWQCSLLRMCMRGWTQHKCPVSRCCESSRGLHKTCGTPRCQHWLPMRWRPSIPQTGHEARDQKIKWEKADTRSRAIYGKLMRRV